MTKKSAPRKTSAASPAKPGAKSNYAGLLKAIESANTQMVGRAAAVVNQALVLRNWLIGAYIVEYEQRGSDRAKYGTGLIPRLARDLAARGVRGLHARGLERCRVFYRIYPQLRGAIPASVTPELPGTARKSSEAIRQPPVAESRTILPTSPVMMTDESTTEKGAKRIRRSVTAELGQHAGKTAIPSSVTTESPGDSPTPLLVELVLQFSWTKLIEFLRVEDPWKRAFYENECLKGNWSKRQLQRQIESLLYERTGLSKNKQVVIQRARAQEPDETIQDLIRDPYVLEFAGLAERPEYSENDLETEVEFATAGIDHQLFVSRYLVALPSADQLRKLLEADRALFTQEHPEINS